MSLANLVKMTVLSTGTGPLTLGAAVPLFRGTEALTDGSTYSYSIQQDGVGFETGKGVFGAGSGTLTRGVRESSNGNAAINLKTGAVVSFTALAEDFAPVSGGGGGGGGGASTANAVTFDKGISGLGATNVQDALVELADRLFITLPDLTFAGGIFPTNIGVGALVATISGKIPGAALSLPGEARVTLGGNDALGWGLYRGTDPVTAGSPFVVTLYSDAPNARNRNHPTAYTLSPITPPTFASIGGFGDSITYGQNASTTANQWLNLLAAGFSITGGNIKNKGIQGTVLQNNADATGYPRANSGRGRYVADTLGANKVGRLYILYGFNDARYVGTGAGTGQMTAAGFHTDLRETVCGMIAGGYVPGDIVLGTPFWISDAGLATGSPGFAGQSRAGFENYVSRVALVAAEMGTLFADVYAYCRDHGGPSLVSGDNIHPNDTGHVAIKTAFLAAAIINQRPPATTVTGSNPSTGVFGVTWAAPSYTVPVDHYLVDCFASENPVLSSQVTVPAGTTTTSLSVTGGTMFGRVITVFADGSAAPAAISTTGVYIAPPAAQFLNDTFTDTDGTTLPNHSGETGQVWAVASGFVPSPDNAISNNRMYSPSGAGVYYALAAPNKAEYDITFTLDCVSSNGACTTGVMGRYDPSSQFYFADYRDGVGWRLGRTIGSTSVILGTFAQSFGTGQAKVAILHIRNTPATRTINGSSVSCNIWLDVDGVSVLGASDTNITGAGYAGVRTTGGATSSAGIHMREISATTI